MKYIRNYSLRLQCITNNRLCWALKRLSEAKYMNIACASVRYRRLQEHG